MLRGSHSRAGGTTRQQRRRPAGMSRRNRGADAIDDAKWTRQPSRFIHQRPGSREGQPSLRPALAGKNGHSIGMPLSRVELRDYQESRSPRAEVRLVSHPAPVGFRNGGAAKGFRRSSGIQPPRRTSLMRIFSDERYRAAVPLEEV